MEASLSHATVERYTRLFVEDDLASEVFHRVGSAFVGVVTWRLGRRRRRAK